MEPQHQQIRKKQAFAGYVSIAGALSMLIGAAFWAASGTDLWQAIADSQMEDYLSNLDSVRHLLVINTFFWILGVILLATAGTLMAEFCDSRPALAQMGMVFMRTACSIAIVSFIAMLALAFHHQSLAAASLTGWVGARLDDIATMMLIGYGPLCLSISGVREWVPRWLNTWGLLAGLAGLIGLIGLLTGTVILGFIIIPFGIGWMIAAGLVLIKRSKMR
ncbi:hypothetical protein SAMN04488057_1257 [Cyclobacterium lianum]|uniref:DUF4386 domain-containing protein n=1 Tax=Cyclobacterium lianum TaxID=388280 RepID=A0A1M7QUJ9_9BACT|nr:hypothetical protein [Cyclobacterium lianum]SHN35134.1 hypothetical protein SAMN04488057_1257 [Cyclobacterium lianum]